MVINPQQGSVGVQIVYQFIDESDNPIDISAATVTKILFEKPSKITGEWNAVFLTDGKDGKIKFTTQDEEDLDEYMTYRIQGYYEDPLGKWYGTVSRFFVQKSLLAEVE